MTHECTCVCVCVCVCIYIYIYIYIKLTSYMLYIVVVGTYLCCGKFGTYDGSRGIDTTEH
jgi:hypothetical protein